MPVPRHWHPDCSRVQINHRKHYTKDNVFNEIQKGWIPVSSAGMTPSTMQFTFKNKRSSISFCCHDISLKIKILSDLNEMFYKSDEFI